MRCVLRYTHTTHNMVHDVWITTDDCLMSPPPSLLWLTPPQLQMVDNKENLVEGTKASLGLLEGHNPVTPLVVRSRSTSEMKVTAV